MHEPLRIDPRGWLKPSRREALVAGALSAAGLSLPGLLAAESRTKLSHQKSVILIVPWGGPCQLDTLDLKPDAPDSIRGEFKPIATKIAGFQICEHLPKLAERTDQFSIVRSASHRISTHNPATHYALTGHKPSIVDKELTPATRADFPSLGSVLARLQPTAKSVPAYVMEPCSLVDQNAFSGGQHAGFWGPAHDPFIISKDPSKPDFAIDGLELSRDMAPERLEERKGLLDRLDAANTTGATLPHYERAYDLLRSAATRQAFDLRQEPVKLRERYGLTRYGQSVLLARRLIEAGVRLVLVSDTIFGTNSRWDTHENGSYSNIKKQLPETDLALSALLDDLTERGLLESTLVLWMAEFGRTPKLSQGGRDHWPQCYSFLAAGGGIQGGRVIGSSDKHAAFPKERPVGPEDIHATIHHLLGIERGTVITDNQNRPVLLCDGRPIRELFA